jgi:hypothetical protein
MQKKHKSSLLTGRTACDFRKLGVIAHIVNTSLYTCDSQAFRLGILMAATSKYSEIIFHENICKHSMPVKHNTYNMLHKYRSITLQ